MDDCCRVRNFYQCYFPLVPFKLDIFHAVQRIVKTLPKGTVESQKFAKEVGLLFHRDGDIGEERMFLLLILIALKATWCNCFSNGGADCL